MVVVRVAGGTNAGWMTMRPKPTEMWECECPAGDPPVSYSKSGATRLEELTPRKVNPPHLVNCLGCGARRPR
jgi:hypothetical protein